MGPVSHVNAPVRWVEVWAMESLFFQATLVPTSTVSGLGQYARDPSCELFALIEMITSGVVPATGLDFVLHERTVRQSATAERIENLPRPICIVGASRNRTDPSPSPNIARGGRSFARQDRSATW